MYFSNFLRRMISAPYFPWVPLSTSRKYACRLFSTANLELLSSIQNRHQQPQETGNGGERKKETVRSKVKFNPESG